MATTQPKKHYNGSDYQNNEIKNVKTPTPVPESNDKTVCNTEFVKQNVIVNTTTSTAQETANDPDGAFEVGTQIHGVSLIELIEKLAYKRVHPDYATPTIELLLNGSPVQEIGVNQTIQLEAVVVLNDSSGIETNGLVFSGTGIVSNVQQSTVIANIQVTTEESNTYTCSLNYLASTNIKTDTFGDVSTVNSFPSGTVQASVSFDAYWPYFYEVSGTDKSVTTSSQIKALSTKVVGELKDFDITIPKGSTQYVYLALEGLHQNIQILLENAIPIQRDFTVSVVQYEVNGIFHDYTILKHNNGIGYDVDTTYNIKIND